MANYVLSNYLSTIALCGLVGETIAVLLYDMFRTHRKKLHPPDQKGLMCFKRFQALRQKKRIEHLPSLECVSKHMNGGTIDLGGLKE